MALVTMLNGSVFASATDTRPSQQSNPANTVQQTDEWHAPDLYEEGAEGVTMPVLVRETPPNYNAEAMRARIQGVVRMDCIVEVDGTIRTVRIRHSIDPGGLDAEAVRTVRQWLFKPALKDGAPVRMRVVVEISFSLRGYQKPKVEWPDDLRPKDANAKVSDQFRKETLTVENLQITVKYPPDWKVLKDGQNDRLLAVEWTSGHDARGCTLSKPRPVKMDLMAPLTTAELKAHAKRIKEELAKDVDVELVKVGQMGAGDHLWVWSEMFRRRLDPLRLLPDAAGSFAAQFESMRIWQFTTTDSWRQLSVICDVFIPRGATKDSSTQTVRRAGEDFAAIMRGISIRPQ